MPKIFENTASYLLGKSYVVWSFKQYYDEIIVIGQENIPENEPVIFAPNHLNALMDALAILSLPPFRQVKVYLGRADLFRLPRPVVDFLRFAKIMPAYRIRDGYKNLKKNKSSFETADEVLLNNAAICIMPEGDQGTERKIRPLVKGIFRIAFSTQEKMPKDKTVHIVPVGIDLGHFTKFGKHLIINIGKPIKVSEYAKNYRDNPATAINILKEKLQLELKKLVLDLSSDKHYTCFETAVEAVNTAMLKELNLEKNTQNLFFARQHTARILIQIEQNDPETIEYLEKACKRYKSGMQKLKLDSGLLERNIPNKQLNILNYIKTAFAITGSLPGISMNAIPLVIISLFPKIMKIEFSGFYSSIYYAAGIILFPLFYILQSFLLISLCTLPWWLALIFVPAHFMTGKLSFRLYKKIRFLLSDIHLYNIARKHTKEFNKLQKIKRQITETLLNRAV